MAGPKRTLQFRGNLGFDNLYRRPDFTLAKFGEDDAEYRIRFKPPGKIRLANAGAQHHRDLLQHRIRLLTLGSLAVDQH